MRFCVITLVIVFISCKSLLAQDLNDTTKRKATRLPFREVSGLVNDSTGRPVAGATLTLTSQRDTLKTSCDNDGIFVFDKVQMATFTITVSGIGWNPKSFRYLQNAKNPKLVLDPIVINSSITLMQEVKVNGSSTITYKTDTVEYRATDYVVREDDTVDELLKKMDGFEVGKDGTVLHFGQEIKKAKLNGKLYAGGDVAQAIQNLPADIVSKIQVVDDYGDIAARTGIKDGNSEKILNITTKAEKSVGTTAKLTGQLGNKERYNANIFAQYLNANQVIGLIGNSENVVNQDAQAGTSKKTVPSFNYRDQWSKFLQINSSYKYYQNDDKVVNKSYGQNYSIRGTNNFTDQANQHNTRFGHNFNLEIEFNLDSTNYILVTPSINYSEANGDTNSGNTSLGWLNQKMDGFNHNLNSSKNLGITAFYQHIFKKRRNISFQVSLSRVNNVSNTETRYHTLYYADSLAKDIIGDSIMHSLLDRGNNSTTYRGSITYVEPLTKYSQFEFNGQIKRTQYDNRAIYDTVLNDNIIQELPERNNIYNYSFTETRLTLNYRLTGSKHNLSLGSTLVQSLLSGIKVNASTSDPILTKRADFRVLPVLRYSYVWSSTKRLTLNYTGTNVEPDFIEIQPFTDKSNPQNPIVGNPNLRLAFNHTLNAQFYTYVPNIKLNYSFGLSASKTQNQVSVNNLQIQQAVGYITETHFVNLNGAYSISGKHNISKQLYDRKYNLQLSGNISYSHTPSMSDNKEFFSDTWRIDERFGPRISPNELIEINPYVGYEVVKSSFAFPGQETNIVKTTSLAIDGINYFSKDYLLTYNISKKIISGLTGINTSPLIINVGFEKKILKKKNLSITFNVYDLLKQNNFIHQNIGVQSVTNVISNSLSRYFLFGIRLNLQRWGGKPMRNGKEMKRRGDGSFVY